MTLAQINAMAMTNGINPHEVPFKDLVAMVLFQKGGR